jgi:hypothetical protein
MKRLYIVLFFCLVVTAQAIDWNASLRYWYYQNVSTDVPHTLELVQMTGNDNATVQIDWFISPHPTREQLIALEPAAVAFWAKKEKQKQIDPVQWQNQELARAITNLIALVNLRLPKTNQITMAEFTNTMNKAISATAVEAIEK